MGCWGIGGMGREEKKAPFGQINAFGGEQQRKCYSAFLSGRRWQDISIR